MSMFDSIVNVTKTVQGVIIPSKFMNQNTNEITTGQSVVFFVILMFIIYFTMLIGAFVFNTSIVKIFPSVKKVSVIDFFGLYIVLHLLFC